jgi:hypothetical protein
MRVRSLHLLQVVYLYIHLKLVLNDEFGDRIHNVKFRRYKCNI